MPKYLLDERDVAEIRRVLAKVDGVNGPGVTNAPDSLSFSPPPIMQTVVTDRPRGGATCRWVRITSSSPLPGFANRWVYTGVIQDLKPLATFTDGAAAESLTFYSSIESGNTGEGIEGSGDNLADFPPGVDMRPLGTGGIVRVCQFIDCFGGSLWIAENTPNNAGGSCE